MPLHVSMGLGQHFLNVCEQNTITIDKNIKESSGKATANLDICFQQRQELLDQCESLNEQQTSLLSELNSLKERVERQKEQSPQSHTKNDGAYIDKIRTAIDERKIVSELIKAQKEVEKKIEKI